MITGRSAPRSSSAARSIASPSAGAAVGRVGQLGGRVGVHLGLHEHVVEREVEEGRARWAPPPPCAGPRPRARGCRRWTLRRAGQLGQRARRTARGRSPGASPAPAHRRGPAAEREQRRAVLQRGRHAAHPVGHPGPGGERAHARLARGLGPALGGEHGRLLVADVDDVDALLAAAVVDREEVPAREREELGHAVRLQALRHQPAAVETYALLRLRPRWTRARGYPIAICAEP